MFGGFEFQQQQQMWGSMAGSYMAPGPGHAGLYGMGAAAAAGGFGGEWGNRQGPGPGAYDPATAAYKRAAWAAGRQQRQQPMQPSRRHKKHRCNKCWRELAGEKNQHKNGKTDWEQGERCEGNCAVCGRLMSSHTTQPCPAPVQT
jgi:hypothetical protein